MKGLRRCVAALQSLKGAQYVRSPHVGNIMMF